MPIPTPQQVVEHYRPLLRLIVEALRRGTVHSQEYADWQDEGIDRALAPAHVRKGAKRFLLEQGQEVQNEEEVGQVSAVDFETEFLSNLGLCIRSGLVQMRILRSAQGSQLPVPGHSLARQDYYTQSDLPFEDEVISGSAAIAGKFIVHWSTDVEYNLDRVYLACPRSGGLTRESVQAHWDWPIWRRHGIVIDGQVQAEVTDLDIYLEDEATGT